MLSFFKDPVDVVVYIFYMQLCFSLSTLFFSASKFSYHNSLKLCTTKVFFSIESIKISNELSNQTQYLYLQLDCLNKIRCFDLKLILLFSGDISLNPWPNWTNYQLTENLKVFKNRGLHFIHLNINSLLSKTGELKELVKASNAMVVGITELKLDDSINNCEICIEGYDIIRCDHSRKSRGVVCYVSNKICFT